MNIQKGTIRRLSLAKPIDRVFDLAVAKVSSKSWNPAKGTPVFTVKGQYTSRGWTGGRKGFNAAAAITTVLMLVPATRRC